MEATRVVTAAPKKPRGQAASWAFMAALAVVGAVVALWDAGEVTLPRAEVAGELVTVGASGTGRLATLSAIEGQEVAAGQVLAALEDEERRMAVTRAEAELAAAEGGLKVSRTGVSVQAAQLSSRIAQARAGVAVAEATLRGAEARAAQARLDVAGLKQGMATGAVSIQQVVTAETAVKTADAEVGSSKSQLAIARATLRLAESGAGDVAVSQAGVEAGKAGLGRIWADVAAARLQLAEGTILAPTAGRVAKVLVHGGEQVAIGQPICTLATGKMWVEALADEAVIDRLKVGAPAWVRFTSRPGVEVPAKVEGLSALLERPVTAATTGLPAMRVRIALTTPQPWLRPGMSASVRITK